MFRLIIIFFSILSLGFVQFISPANAEYFQLEEQQTSPLD